eukprot:COSAG02_NODE_11717_length_1668_cov_7.739324_2_plen_55_part_01
MKKRCVHAQAHLGGVILLPLNVMWVALGPADTGDVPFVVESMNVLSTMLTLLMST